MNTRQLRARLLAAAGLLAPSLASLGCPSSTSVAPAPDQRTTPDPSQPAPSATTPSERPTAMASSPTGLIKTLAPTAVKHGDGWLPASAPPRDHVKGCSHGVQCFHATADPMTANSVEALYSNCATSIRPASGEHFHYSFANDHTTKERAHKPDACCYKWDETDCRGRALRGEGHWVAASAERREDWVSDLALELPVPASPAVRASLADHWAREAALEHASVASFARASLALMAFGAPAELLARYHLAALDEIEHARVAYAFASCLAGEPVGPSALPSDSIARPPRDVTAFAVEALHDACIGETVAVLQASEALEQVTSEPLRAFLARVIEDEARHAEVAWATLAWALRTGGQPTREALAAELRRLRKRDDRIEASDDAVDLRPHGVLPGRTLALIRSGAVREIVVPCLERLVDMASPSTSSARVKGEGRRTRCPSP